MGRICAPSRRRLPAIVVAAVVCALAAAATGAGAPPSLKQQEQQKEAQARSVQARIAKLQQQVSHASEAYDGARYRLAQIEQSRRENTVALRRARKGFAAAQARAAARIVAIYESGEPTTADALLGATTVTSILDRLQAVDSATTLDRSIAQQVAAQKRQLVAHAAALATARQQQVATIAELASQRRQILSSLRKVNALASTIQGQIATLRAKEAAEQQRLLAQARARLAAEAAARAAAEARARAARERAQQEAAAAAAAKAAKAAQAQAAQTTTATTTAPAVTTAATTTAEAPAPPAPTSTAPAPTTTVATPPPAPTGGGGGHPAAAQLALQYLGVPYLWGGATPAGFDCSGLVMYVFAKLGVSLPHYAAAQYQLGVPVARSDLQPGDLVFFNGLDHVGIWLGGNQFVDAPQTGDVVKIETMTSWYASTYVGARRI
jgi:cell wall-associated NlpC family hydrolase